MVHYLFVVTDKSFSCKQIDYTNERTKKIVKSIANQAIETFIFCDRKDILVFNGIEFVSVFKYYDKLKTKYKNNIVNNVFNIFLMDERFGFILHQTRNSAEQFTEKFTEPYVKLPLQIKQQFNYLKDFFISSELSVYPSNIVDYDNLEYWLAECDNQEFAYVINCILNLFKDGEELNSWLEKLTEVAYKPIESSAFDLYDFGSWNIENKFIN